MYLVVVKFREAGATVREDWFLTRLGRKVGTLSYVLCNKAAAQCAASAIQVPRWMSIDLRTTRGQNKYLRVSYAVTLGCWIILLNIGDKVCLRL